MKDLLTLIGQAEFRGWIAAPGEIAMRYTGLAEIKLTEVGRNRYRATWHAKAPRTTAWPLIGLNRQPIEGPLTRVKREVSERFEQQIEPWRWTRNGRQVTEPEE